MSAHSAKKSPAVPRPSASAIVLNDADEVLLVHRHPKSSSFAGTYVFPGGNTDAGDGTPEMTAIRETFEESGVLLASASVAGARWPSKDDMDAVRKDVHAQRLPFSAFLGRHSLTPDVHALLPFTQWITPATVPKRFHTHFFLTFLPPSTSISGGAEHHLPTPDGGLEVVSTMFIHPLAALAEHVAGRMPLMPPQYYLLSTLADVLAKPDSRTRLRSLAHGRFGRMVITPKWMSTDPHGRVLLTYEGDEARGGPPGRRHRALITNQSALATAGGDSAKAKTKPPPRAPARIELERNFDVFDEGALAEMFPGSLGKDSLGQAKL